MPIEAATYLFICLNNLLQHSLFVGSMNVARAHEESHCNFFYICISKKCTHDFESSQKKNFEWVKTSSKKVTGCIKKCFNNLSKYLTEIRQN